MPAGHTADVTETSKYSRFQANKKTCAFATVTAYSREVAVASGTVENGRLGYTDGGHFREDSEYHDHDNSSARTCWGRAGRPPGHRWRRRSRAGHGLSAAHGSAHGARHFAFYFTSANRIGGVTGILETGPSGPEGWHFVRL